MDSAIARHRRPPSGIPVGLRVAVVLALPMIGAVSVTGIYLTKEILVAAAWVAMGLTALVFVEPLVGVGAMTATFMLVAYPTIFQTLGFLTVNNLLGLCLGVLLVAQVLSTRDLSVLTLRPVLIFAAIGIALILSTAHAGVAFPTLMVTHGTGPAQKALDKTSDLMHDYWTRLAFLLFFCSFVRNGRDARAMFYTFALVLFLAVPSALINWWQGTLSHGFRTESSITAGSNPNRLAMICLMEIACWWCWAVVRRGKARRWVALGAIGGAFLVVLASGSRSGFLGCGVLALLMQTGPRRFRVSRARIAMMVVAGAIAIVTIVPPEAWQRALAFGTENKHAGSTQSIIAREKTIETGMQMVRDHPVLGVGLGNFREVARQIYLDPYFRPPHNSYMWAAAEGGLLVFGGYVLLFFFSWRDLTIAQRLVDRDPACAWMLAAMRSVFYIYCFFAGFADLWLNPITYVVVGTIICLRRHLERMPAVVPAAIPARALARAA